MTTVRLPEKLSYGAVGGAQFSTDVVACASGFEQRNSNWRFPRAKYSLSESLETREDVEQLINFFNVHRGRALSFRFKDFCDYKVIEQKLGAGNGKQAQFQLIKTYAVGEMSMDRKITKPVQDSLKVYVDDKAVAFTCDCETGVVTLNEIPNINAVITADFEFDVQVRFDVDHIEISPDPMHCYRDVTLVEVEA